MPLLLHRIEFNLNLLEKDGCRLAHPPELFKALLLATGNDPCSTGCAYYAQGTCPAYLKHHSVPEAKRQRLKTVYGAAVTSSPPDNLIGGKWKGMTTAQIIAAENISKGEFQKRKQAGHYKT